MIKIIAGKYRGRKLLQVPKTNVRPTQAVVRKSMFDILGSLDGFSVLDLYSGVGTLGIEGVSRGAASLVSVERDKFTHKVLSDNLDMICSEDDTLTYNMDVKQFIKFNNRTFDLIIADPPYNIDAYSYLNNSLRTILNKDGILCIEMKKREVEDDSVRIRTFGRTQLTFWRNK
tara:strand:- start:23 stop:541 length:519 start_codon:yes stop_codon:yes gene_type:complete